MPVRRGLKIGGVVLVAIPLLFWGLVTLIVPGVIRDQARAFGEQIGYRIELGEVELTPLLLRARVRDVRLAPENASADRAESDALFTLKQIEVDARFLPLLIGRLNVQRIVLDEPTVLLARGAASGRQQTSIPWNWQTLVERVQKLGADAPPAKPDEHHAIRINADEFSINAGRVLVRDGQSKVSYELGPFSLRLSDISNQDDTGHVGGSSLSSQYALNLGSVKVPLPHVDGVPDRQLVFDKVTASGSMIENSESVLRAGLDLGLDAGTVKSTWQMAANGTLNGKIDIENLAVKPWLSLAPSYQPLDSPSGVIGGAFELKQDAEALTVDGDIKVDQLDIRVSGAKEPLLAWATTSLSKLHLSLPRAEGKAGLLTMNEVLVNNPRIRFVIDAQRQSNFRSLFSKPEPVASVRPASAEKTTTLADGASTNATPVATSPTSATSVTAQSKPVPVPPKPSAAEAPSFRYDIRSVRLKNGAMFFGDESIKPVFHVDVTDLNGSLQGISNEPRRNATLVLNGRAARTGSLRARGQLAFADPRQNNDVSLIFRNIPLNTTNPYAMTFAGYPIEDGRIDVDLRYVTKDGELQGKNRFVIKKIKLGEPVPDYQGTRLPLGLAIALLEDSDGMIDVNIPVKGNVNEPEFSVGHLVWQAVKTVLTNVVTAPFRALGALLGIENLDAIGFVPGESALPLEDEEQLTKIAELLAKRPKSKLVIHGTYDPSVDAAELARAMADKAILEASGLKVVPGEPLPLPNLTDPKVKSGLKSAYGSQVGRIKLGQRLLSLPDNAERDNQLRQELIASYKISDEQLKQLAAQRAEAVKTRLLSVDKNLSERISIGDPETVSADESRIPLRVQIETGS